ncbi:MAG: glutamate--tRNA ligase [Saprospiraceae bacterium]|nr:glutamate--tRNA ligase [Saprospiraceae bacterium]
MSQNIRVRFAPSPTGPLHIGGVRTALYNYLFAKKHGGTFILRIEDTDQTRYVDGAEDYIIQALKWLGLNPDEGPGIGGDFGPYRQSERKNLYKQYAEQLIENGYAYYAFDTPEELDAMRKREEEKGFHSAKYDHRIRMQMRNSLTLLEEECKSLIEEGQNVTVRLKIPQNEEVAFDDIVRERVVFSTDELDDKIILKKDGMPTYHLANIVDDHLMEISHVIRGEEWLSSTAHHVLMYKFFGWEPPKFTHLPLLLKPTGKGKLSKRDGAKFGFPVFPMEWQEDELYLGFKEEGFDPEAVLNFLVLLGWNPGNDEEIMDRERMIELFSLEKIIKSGARFDIEKAYWFNQQYIIASSNEALIEVVKEALGEDIVSEYDDEFLLQFIHLMKERVKSINDFKSEGAFFFEMPGSYDEKQVRKRYSPDLDEHFESINRIIHTHDGDAASLADAVKSYLNENELKMGVYLPLLRIMLCGSMKGPDLFEIIRLLGVEIVNDRIAKALNAFKSIG